MFLSFNRLMLLCSILAAAHGYAQGTSPPAPSASLHPASQWIAVSWDDLPQIFEDNPREALGAWLTSCARSQAAWRLVCNELSALKNADPDVLRIWLQARLQPYRVAPLTTSAPTTSSHEGLLTGYYEPIFKAKRVADERYRYPLFALPPALAKNRSLVWSTREEIDKSSDSKVTAIAYLDDPMDVLALQIQGSGLLDLQDVPSNNNAVARIRLAFAGSNNQPYKSVGAWLRDTHSVRELTWPAIKAWATANPQQINALLWSNPRVVFFKEEVATPEGPKGAAGVPLSAGRSIAVDPKSIPYGTPVWLASAGAFQVQRLVMAQDTGSAIVGAVRADFYVGSGEAAGDIAGRLKQPLQLWVLWPK